MVYTGYQMERLSTGSWNVCKVKEAIIIKEEEFKTHLECMDWVDSDISWQKSIEAQHQANFDFIERFNVRVGDVVCDTKGNLHMIGTINPHYGWICLNDFGQINISDIEDVYNFNSGL